MKIGVMLRHFGQPGGIGVYTVNLLNSLLEIDRDNFYHLLFQKKEQLGHFAKYSNVKEHLLSAWNIIAWDQLSVPLLARREKIDLLYNPKIALPLLTRRKTVGIIHGCEQLAVPSAYLWYDRIYFMLADRLYFAKADAVITTTQIGAKEAVRYMKVNERKIHVVNMAYNESCRLLENHEKSAIKEKYRLPDKFLLFVGGINPVKNLTNIIKAYHLLLDKIPHKLVVVGFWRWKYSEVTSLIKDLNLQNRVIFTDYIPDKEIPAIYNLADVFVFPSLYEGFGLPTLEAMACGCPVVSTVTGCTPEVAGDAAVLVDPYDVQQIADGILKILADDNLRADLVRKGLSRVRHFSWNRCATETLKVFEAVGGH